MYSGQCDVVLGYHAALSQARCSRGRPPATRSGAGAASARSRAAAAGDDRRGGRLHGVGVAIPARVRRRAGGLRASRRSTTAPTRCATRGGDARPADHGRLPARADDPLAAVPARHGRPRRRRRRVRHHHRPSGRATCRTGPCSSTRRPSGRSTRTRRTRPRASGATVSRSWSTRSGRKSDFWIDDCDVYFPYDGFTIITLNWFENAGFVRAGRGGRVPRRALGRRHEPRPHRRPDPGEPPRRRAVRRRHPGIGPPPRSGPPAPGTSRRAAGRRRPSGRSSPPAASSSTPRASRFAPHDRDRPTPRWSRRHRHRCQPRARGHSRRRVRRRRSGRGAGRSYPGA